MRGVTAVRTSTLAAVAGALTLALTVASAPASAQPAARPSQCGSPQACYAEAYRAAFDTYIYGLPLAMTARSAEVATNVRAVSPPGTPTGRAPMNQFTVNTLASSAFTDIVLPSVSTPYSNAFLDLSKGPIVLSIPDIATREIPGVGPRFFLFQVLDAWTNVGGEDSSCLQGADGFCGLGTRYQTQAGDYLFVRTGWKGTVPAGIRQVITIDTDLGWIAGRTLTNGTTEDLQTVTELQQQYRLTPLQHYGKRWTPPANSPVDPTVDMTTPAVQQVEQMDAPTFYEYLSRLMQSNPPSPSDATAVSTMASLGLRAGRPFSFATMSPTQQAAARDAYAVARDFVVRASQQTSDGAWIMNTTDGAWPATREGYLERAVVAYSGLGANLYKDAVYAGAISDQNGDPLTGPNCYRLTFDTLPPANPAAFWSVTLYNKPGENLFDAQDPVRNGVGIPSTQGNDLVLNEDGSVDIYIQPDAPTSGVGSDAWHNWLPSPPDSGFVLLLRMYWPDQSLLSGDWVPPVVQSADCR